ncbi:MAG: dihydrofolate reductase [Proteobacteria bacterium]|nr:dihydrofolate reductase [Pseudomonadota bacterium]
MTLILLAAVAGKNRVIGKNGNLPWHFPSDLKFFKETTLGHAVLMGRVTYESILQRLKKPLPGRETLVLTRDIKFQDTRVKIIRRLEDIDSWREGETPLFVVGGAQVYAQTLPMAQKLYITHIDQEIAGDAFFPEIDPARWRLENTHPVSENGVNLRFCTYGRIP